MRGMFHISDGPEQGRPHQSMGESYFTQFEDFPELRVGDQFGLQSWDGKVHASGLIVHARTYDGKNDSGEDLWVIHCHVYRMRAGFPAVSEDTLARLNRKQKPAVPRIK